MKNALFVFLALCASVSGYSQSGNEPAQKPVEVKWSGFILNHFYYDSRKNLEAVDGQVVLFPLPEELSAEGDDLNAVHNLNLLSLASRMRSNITGPDAFGAATSGLFEIDFTSRATSATIRFRQAWVKFAWQKTELLVGRTWHPLSSTDVAPVVNSLNWGAPFQPFNRSDQIMLTRTMGKVSLAGSLIFQNDYTLNGPSGKTFNYQTNSLHPELHLQLKYRSEKLILGAGADYKKILPRTYTTSPLTSLKYTTDESYNSLAFLGYAQVKTGKLTIATKSIFATNISENLMAGGFGISSLDSVTGHETYTPYKHFYIWGNLMYGNVWKVGIFGGYFKNMGALDNLAEGTVVYGLGEKIAYMYRITPVISYTSGKATLAAELECNNAAYGTIDHADHGKIINAEEVRGVRALFSLMWTF